MINRPPVTGIVDWRAKKQKNMNENEEPEIDLLKLFQALWRKAWTIGLTAVAFAVVAFGIREVLTVRNHYEQVLKELFHHKMFRTRVNTLDIPQEKMAQRLTLSSHSYVDPEYGKTSCSAVTPALFPVYISNAPNEFPEELRYAFAAIRTKVYRSSSIFMPLPAASHCR